MGLMLWLAESNDDMVVFVGCRTPYIIRRKTDDSNSIVEEAYIHSIIFGELFSDGIKMEDFFWS